jgi:hypothetical protein
MRKKSPLPRAFAIARLWLVLRLPSKGLKLIGSLFSGSLRQRYSSRALFPLSFRRSRFSSQRLKVMSLA